MKACFSNNILLINKGTEESFTEEGLRDWEGDSGPTILAV